MVSLTEKFGEKYETLVRLRCRDDLSYDQRWCRENDGNVLQLKVGGATVSALAAFSAFFTSVLLPVAVITFKQ